VKAKPFVIGFIAVIVCVAAASIYFNLIATRPEKSVTAVASPDGRYKAVRVSLARGGAACFDTISIFLAVYPDSFAESEKTYEVYAGPCAPSALRAALPKMQWLSNTALQITYAPGAGDNDKRRMRTLDASKFVHVTFEPVK
jgi:hypothetical protein